MAPPDWSRITHEIACPLCDYNLFGLDRPRCPECGYGFEWSEVMSPRRQRHPYLFEHHPECNVRSWRQTWVGAWRPRRFWKSLHPAQPSRPLRLLAYWFIGLVFIPIVLPALVLYPFRVETLYRSAVRSQSEARLQRSSEYREQIIARHGSERAFLDWLFPRKTMLSLFREHVASGTALRHREGQILAFYAPPLLLIWPWLTLASLLVFQISIRRARIRTIHLARCVLYCFDIPSWCLILLAGTIGLSLAGSWIPLQQRSIYSGVDLCSLSMLLLLAVSMCVGAWRLYQACALYLRFSWPAATVVASQAIALLVLMVVLYHARMILLYVILSTLGLMPSVSW